MLPGERTVMAMVGRVEARFRLRVGRPPLRLRHDTDRCCRELIRQLDDAGYCLNNVPLGQAIALLDREMRQEGR
jgi:hypothetical protein